MLHINILFADRVFKERMNENTQLNAVVSRRHWKQFSSWDN